jgi:lysophospholipase L1-like esterase
MKRVSQCAWMTCLMLLSVMASAQPQVLRLSVQLEANPAVATLVCPPKGKSGTSAAGPAPSLRPQEAQDPQEMPDEQDLQGLLETIPTTAQGAAVPNGREGPVPSLLQRPQGRTWRIGIWGDSHTAAAFWSDALSRQLAPELGGAAAQLYPANFLRAGVRHPGLKRICLDGVWRHESAHAQLLAQSLPGPGLMSMHSQAPGSALEIDVRGSVHLAAQHTWRWLLQNQDLSQPLHLAFSADGGPEQLVVLPASDQAMVVQLQSAQPLSRLRLRLVSGHLRLQGLLAANPQAPVAESLRMDVFGYPGATLAGWQMVDVDRFLSWKQEWSEYDLVVLAYGTNEGNVRPFQANTYRQMLEQALVNLRRAFPSSACLLVGPGDRGVLIRRSQKRAMASANALPKQQSAAKKTAKKTANKTPSAKPPTLSEAQLLAFSHVHAQINRIQKEIGAAHGCVAWSAQEAMGGAGSAYRWGLQKPPLMARDLLHFTAGGYQELAKKLAKDMGWAD